MTRRKKQPREASAAQGPTDLQHRAQALRKQWAKEARAALRAHERRFARKRPSSKPTPRGGARPATRPARKTAQK